MLKMLKKNDGFTLVEVMIVFVILFIIVFGGYFFLLKTVCQGNFWYADSSVLKELKIDHSQVTEVLKTTRNVFDDSVITVKENNEIKKYCLDTSILWNYDFSNCKE